MMMMWRICDDMFDGRSVSISARSASRSVQLHVHKSGGR